MTTFSYPLTYPTVKGVAQATVTPRSVVGRTRSPFTGEVQVQVHTGQFWELTVVHPKMKRADSEIFFSFFTRLNMGEGTFLFGDPLAGTPQGTASASPGTPLVDGGGQTGNDLNIKGAPSGETGWLLEGDYVQIGTGGNARYHKILLDADTDSVGDATLVIWPNLRESPADNTTVVVQNAKGVFRLTGEAPVSWNEELGGFYSFEISIEEVL